MTKVVVLGGSFGGLTAAFELKRLLGKEAEITVVSDDDRFVFLPSLPWPYNRASILRRIYT